MYVSELFSPLTEGINDKYTFKAMFVIGAPGSGKSTIVNKFFKHLGFKAVDPDIVGEYLSKKHNKTLNREDWSTHMLDHMDSLVDKKMAMYINGRLPLVFDSTGRNTTAIKERFIQLNRLGYNCGMIFVDTDINTAINRNLNRPRKVPLDYLRIANQQVRDNLQYYKSLFKDDFFVLENTSSGFPTHTIKQLAKDINKFVQKPVQNLPAIKWKERKMER